MPYSKEEKKEYNKKYREEHKEKSQEYDKKWREENKEKISEYNKKYKEENKEKILEYNKKWREENKEYYKEYNEKNKKWREEYDKKYRELNREKKREQRKEKRAHCIEYLGGKCVVCGTTHNLQFDHIKREGKKYNITEKLTYKFDNIKEELDKCQLLCAPCHLEKTAKEWADITHKTVPVFKVSITY